MTISMDHGGHGQGSEANGPDEADCPCRVHSIFLKDCAAAGCGFCRAASSSIEFVLRQEKPSGKLTPSEIETALVVLKNAIETSTFLRTVTTTVGVSREATNEAFDLARRLGAAQGILLTALGRDLEAILPQIASSVSFIEAAAKDLERASRTRDPR